MAVVRHKEAIHSGHFMVSNFEAEAQDDEEDIAVPVRTIWNFSVIVIFHSAQFSFISIQLFRKLNLIKTPAMNSKWFPGNVESRNTFCLDLDLFKVPEEEEGVDSKPNIKHENVKDRFTYVCFIFIIIITEKYGFTKKLIIKKYWQGFEWAPD